MLISWSFPVTLWRLEGRDLRTFTWSKRGLAGGESWFDLDQPALGVLFVGALPQQRLSGPGPGDSCLKSLVSLVLGSWDDPWPAISSRLGTRSSSIAAAAVPWTRSSRRAQKLPRHPRTSPVSATC